MSEISTPRLLAAAKEFNIGKETLIEFLAGKGFSKDDLKPTSKLSEDMYVSLQNEFQSDKAAKAKSDQIDLPKSQAVEAKKKKDEEEISFRKDDRKGQKPKQADVVASVDAPPASVIVVEETPKQQEVQQITPVVIEAPLPIVVEAPTLVEEKPKPVVVEENKPEVIITTRIKATDIEGPKVISKIDLSSIDSSTKPKKNIKTAPTAVEAVKKPILTKVEIPPVKVPEPVVVAKEEKPAEDLPAVIENIKADKLEGPKILGKINLPVDNDTRPKSSSSMADARKRKRIPFDNRPPNTGGQGGGQQGNNFAPRVNAIDDRNNRPQGGGGQGGGNFQNRPPFGGGQNRPPFGGGQNRPPFGGGQNRPNTGAGAGARRQDKEIDTKEIQDKIKETQAKLAGSSGRGKSLKAKYRKAKRSENAEANGEQISETKIQLTEYISVSEFANLMDVSFADVISKCMSLGIMVSINQRLEADIIELVASEFGFEVEFIDMEAQAEMEALIEEDDKDEEKVDRAPIVTIMGHVDHGKTSLLDYIRNSNVIAGEAGGITQHIGAYNVALPNEKRIAFLDTPGHEAFTAMRARGAKVTDIAIIVVAADDAVMPQTKEAISHAQAANVPMIFAINKIDKDGANPEKIKEQLSAMNILVEDWGGKFQCQELSAKKGLNIDALLEKVLLEAELLELKANPKKEATGTIIEASLDKGKGYVATILVQNGTLNQGDLIVSGQYYGRVKAMFNERNQRVDHCPPSTPVLILGLNGAPQAGEKFKIYKDESEAKEIATRRSQILREQGIRAKKHITLDEIGRRLALGNFKELNLIIKGDFDGSVEALSDSLQKLSTEEIVINVILKAVGQISESDVLLASASDAIIVGFNVRPSMQAAKLADKENIEIKNYSIIYNAIEEIKSAMEGMLEPKIQEKILANVEIRETYKFDKATVAGCFVLDGKLFRNSRVRLIRDGIVVHTGELGSLKRYKEDVKEIANNMECGLSLKNYIDIRVGDVIESFEEQEVKRTL
jgi:translation initiation factor IF-2